MELVMGPLRRLFQRRVKSKVYMSLDSHHWDGVQVVNQPEGEYVRVLRKDQNG